MQCWDTAGQERYRNITANYYRNAQGIMLVYDVTNKKSFEAIDNWMEQIHVHAGDSIDKILVGNKVDQETERKVSNEQGRLLAQKYKLPFIETSAKLGVNVDEAFYAIAKSVMTRLMTNPTDKGGGVSLTAGGKADSNAPLCC